MIVERVETKMNLAEKEIAIKLYQLEHENIKGKLDESGKKNIKQVLVGEELVELREQEQLILDQRSHLNYNIKVKDMSEESRYNR